MTGPADPLAPVRERLEAVTAGWAEGMTLDAIRADFAAYLAEVGPQGVARSDPVPVPGLAFPAAWIGTGARRGLYCHGGGFQIGGIASHAGLIAWLAEAAAARLLAFDYRLAPEYRYPAAAEDSYAAYRWLLDQGAIDTVMGDSAGAALALLTVQHARDQGLSLPRRLVLISPWLDLSMQGDSYTRLADQDIFSKPAQLRAMARSYLGRNGPAADAPEVSPLWGDLSGLPPILIHAGAADITLDDSLQLAERVRAAGGTVDLRIFDGMCHHFQIFEALPQAARSITDIGGWLQQA